MELWKVWFMIAKRVKEYKVEFSTSVTSGWSRRRRSKVEIQFNRMIKDSSAKSDSDNDCGKQIPIAVNEWLWVSDDKVLITFEGRDWSLHNRKSITTPSIGLPGINITTRDWIAWWTNFIGIILLKKKYWNVALFPSFFLWPICNLVNDRFCLCLLHTGVIENNCPQTRESCKGRVRYWFYRNFCFPVECYFLCKRHKQ